MESNNCLAQMWQDLSALGCCHMARCDGHKGRRPGLWSIILAVVSSGLPSQRITETCNLKPDFVNLVSPLTPLNQPAYEFGFTQSRRRIIHLPAIMFPNRGGGRKKCWPAACRRSLNHGNASLTSPPHSLVTFETSRNRAFGPGMGQLTGGLASCDQGRRVVRSRAQGSWPSIGNVGSCAGPPASISMWLSGFWWF